MEFTLPSRVGVSWFGHYNCYRVRQSVSALPKNYYLYFRRTNLAYIDALFMSASSLSTTGLTSVNFADFDLASQIVTLVIQQYQVFLTSKFLMHLGGTIWTTLFPPLVRRYQLKHRYIQPARRRERLGASVLAPPPSPNLTRVIPQELPPEIPTTIQDIPKETETTEEEAPTVLGIPEDEFRFADRSAPPATRPQGI
jgi:hypothetical protein